MSAKPKFVREITGLKTWDNFIFKDSPKNFGYKLLAKGQ